MRFPNEIIINLLLTLVRILQPGGWKKVVAKNLMLKHQLAIMTRSHKKAPNLRRSDRFIPGFLSMLVPRQRLAAVAVAIQPATLLRFHRALVKRKYQALYGGRSGKRPGPGTGPSWLTFLGHSKDSLWSVDLFRCESLKLKSYWVLVGLDQCTRRLDGFGVHAGDVDGITLCRMFDEATSGAAPPRYLSSDNDPLFRFHRWQANLRILEITEIKTVPFTPISHPFVERLIGTVRREYLDHTPFWNSLDLQRKLGEFRDYYNDHRTHTALSGRSPTSPSKSRQLSFLDINNFAWKSHCRGLFHTPMRL